MSGYGIIGEGGDVEANPTFTQPQQQQLPFHHTHGQDTTRLSESGWRVLVGAAGILVGALLVAILVLVALIAGGVTKEKAAIVDGSEAMHTMAQQLRAMSDAMGPSSNGNGNNNNARSLSDISGNTILQRVATLSYGYTTPQIQSPYIGGWFPVSSLPDQNGKVRSYFYVPRTGTGSGGACNQAALGPAPGVTVYNYGIEIKDVTDPLNPQAVGYLAAPVNTSYTSLRFIYNVNTPYFTGTVLVVAFEYCFSQAVHGVLLFNVNDPAHPQQLSPLFGDSSPYSSSSGGCLAVNQFHRPGGVGGFAKGNQLFVTVTDICDQQVFFAPQEDTFDCTDPAHPALVQEWESRDNSTLKFAVPVKPVPYDGPSSPFTSSSEVFYAPSDTTRQHPFVMGPANDVGWTVVDASNPLSFQVVAQSTWPTGGDWLNQAVPSAGNAACIRRSPDGAFALAFHNDGGQSTKILTISDSNSPSNGAVDLVTEEGGNTLRIASIGNKRCGRTVYVGYACANLGVFEPVPLRSSLPTPPAGEDWIAVSQRGPASDPNYASSPCTYGEKMDDIVAAGYTAVLFTNHHANSQPPANSADTVANTGIGNNLYLNTVAFATTHRAQMQMFNRTDDTLALPYPLKSSPNYREPTVGELGARVCLTGSSFRGEFGYTHLLNATSPSLDELAQFMPLNSRFPASVTDTASKSISGCPIVHRSARLALVTVPYDGVYIVRYGGERRGVGGIFGQTNTFALRPVGLIPAQEGVTAAGGGMLPAGADFIYDDAGNTYVAVSEQIGKLHVYRVPDYLL